MPSSYPAGRFSLIALRTALSAARRSAGRAARYWATVEAVMLATIPAERCGRQASVRAGLAHRGSASLHDEGDCGRRRHQGRTPRTVGAQTRDLMLYVSHV